jgi:hypothetical protein
MVLDITGKSGQAKLAKQHSDYNTAAFAGQV